MKYEGMQVYDCDVKESEWLNVRFSQEEKMDEETKRLFSGGKPNKLFEKVGSIFKHKKQEGTEAEAEDADKGDKFPNDESFDRPFYRSEKDVQRQKASGSSGSFPRYGKIAIVAAMIVLLLVAMRFVDKGFAGDVFNYAKSAYTSTVSPKPQEYSINLVSTSAISVENGDILVSGGTIVTCLEEGTVSGITEDSVTVKVNDRLFMTYTGLSEVLVQEGEVISKYGALGRYEETAIVNLLLDGVKVTNLSLDNFTLIWTA